MVTESGESHGRDLVTADVAGIEVDLIAENDRIVEQAETLANEEHLLEALLEVTADGDQVWDVGACLGLHSMPVALAHDNVDVLAFEPMGANRQLLLDNKAVNDLTNEIWVERAALDSEEGTAEFAIRESSEPGYGRHGFDVKEYPRLETTEVETLTGDQVARRSWSSLAPNVIKIDVEGAEGPVLEGMSNVLEHEDCRHVFLETHTPNDQQPATEDFGYTREDLVGLLEEAGFEVEEMSKKYHLHASKEGSQ